MELNLKKQLKRYLELHGFSAAELARRSGVSKQSVSDWLGGVNPSSISQVKKIAEVFGVTVDELCFGDSGDDSSQIVAAESDWIVGVFEGRFRRVNGKASLAPVTGTLQPVGDAPGASEGSTFT